MQKTVCVEKKYFYSAYTYNVNYVDTKLVLRRSKLYHSTHVD